MIRHDSLTRYVPVFLLLAGLLSGCATTGYPSRDPFYRCAEEARDMDQLCHAGNSVGKCLAAARRAESCDALPNAESADEEDHLRNLGLAMVDYFKGGDVKQSMIMREQFEQQFPGRDLHLGEERCSLIDTMRALQGVDGNLRISNACDKLKSDLRRITYWRSH